MNKSFSKIRHIQQSNILLEGRRLNEGLVSSMVKNNSQSVGTQNTEMKEQDGQTLTNKVSTEGIKNVLPQMISSAPFKGNYSGYVFGGTFNGITYEWDCNGVDGMSGIRGFIDGQIMTEIVENFLTAVNLKAPDAKPKSPCVGFYSNNIKFLIYTTTDNKTKCLNFK